MDLFKKLFANPPKPASGGRGTAIVGGWLDPDTGRLRYLKHRGPEHVLCFAPTRSGKGVGLILPTLASCAESVVVADLKGENWLMSSGYRKALGQKVLMFNPTARTIELDENGNQTGPKDEFGNLVKTPEAGSVRFNPLTEVRLGALTEIRDVQNVAEIIMDPTGTGKEGANAHWTNSAIDLAMGLIVHVLYSPDIPAGEKNLAGVLKLISGLALMTTSDPEADATAEAFKVLAEARHAQEGDDYYWMKQEDGTITYTHPAVRGMCGRMLAKADRERGSVVSTAQANLALFADPLVAANTAVSEFAMRDLMHGDQAVSLYLVIPPSDLNRIRPLLRLMVTQMIARLTESIDAKPKHKLLMLLDEFPAFGKLDAVLSSIAFTAGYGIRYYLIVQSLTQLKTKYGDAADDIVSNCHIRIAYAPNETGTAELLSKLCGTTTLHMENISESKDNLVSVLGKSYSLSMQAGSRPLLTPDECMRLPGPVKDDKGLIQVPGDMLIFAAGRPPIYGKQSLWFKDETWKSRIYDLDRKTGIRHPVTSDIIRPAPVLEVRSNALIPDSTPAAAPAMEVADLPLVEVALLDDDESTLLDMPAVSAPVHADPTDDMSEVVSKTIDRLYPAAPRKAPAQKHGLGDLL